MGPSDIAMIGGIISAGSTLGGVVFYMGRLSARVDALEGWRENIRKDFHEVDDAIDKMARETVRLNAVVEERTERRVVGRPGAAAV